MQALYRWHGVRSGLVAGLLLCLAMGSGGCRKAGHQAPQGGSTVPPSKVNLRRNVQLAQVEKRPLISKVQVVGVIEPEARTDIAAGINGLVDEVLFREGDLVDPKYHQPLVLVDQRRYESQLRIAEAAEKKWIATVEIARDALVRAEGSGAGISPQEKKKAAEDLNAAEAELASIRSNLEIARLNLQKSRVLPPYRGQIDSRKVTRGMYVEEKTVIATIADLSRLRLVGYVPESVSVMVRKRMTQRPSLVTARTVGWEAARLGLTLLPWQRLPIELMLAMREIPSGYDPEFVVLPFPHRKMYGALFFMSRTADPSTHMFECKAEIDSSHPWFADLEAGFTARIDFPVESNPDAVVIPEEAVRATERGFIVFEPERKQTRDGQIEWIARERKLELGVRSPGWVEVRSGLRAGQWIVRRGAEALEDGTPLRFPEDQAAELLKSR